MLIIPLSACSTRVVEPLVKNTSSKTDEQPYLLLVSLDGYRWDYTARYQPPNISEFIKNGVQAESLIPCYPSKTFPNHYSIATGMYPDHHGLIANYFYNYDKKEHYTLRDRSKVEDGTFYGGTPIWVQAHNAGIKTASYFFVGTEADILGVRPDYYHIYDGSISNATRVAQVMDWLKMPEDTRPHMITMYMSTMDDTGHAKGPSDEDAILKSLLEVDRELGRLFDGVKATKLPVNIIIVSDHGMTDISIDQYIPLEKVKEYELYTTISSGVIVNIHPKEGVNVDSLYAHLKSKEDNFKVYKTAEAPHFELTPESKNWGPIQIVPDQGYYFLDQRLIGMKRLGTGNQWGVHGYSPDMKDMHGILYASGPAFKSDYTTASVKNIHIYPLMCAVLGLDIPTDIDGKLSELEDVMK